MELELYDEDTLIAGIYPENTSPPKKKNLPRYKNNNNKQSQGSYHG